MKRRAYSDLIMRKEWNQVKAWWIASRPRALLISLITVGVGTTLSYSVKGQINGMIALYALLFSIFIQIGTHYINDAFDFTSGVDTAERFGFPKVTQSGLIAPKYMLMGGFICLAIALLLGVPLLVHGGWPLAVVLIICVLNGYFYTGGPVPLSYSGLGDLFAFLFFGVIGTLVVYYLQTEFLDGMALLAGVQVGLLATMMTAINNLRDIKSDAQANKRTLAVRFGKTFARAEITGLAFLPFILGLGWLYMGYYLSAFLPILTWPLACKLVTSIWTTEPGPHYNQLFTWGLLFQFLFCLLLSTGYLIT